MGAWGAALFSDDTACDVRDGYRELLEDGTADDEATRLTLDSWAGSLTDPGEAASVWLALAFTQSRLGRLDPAVRDRALAVIDDGSDLARWADQTPAVVAKRRSALAKVRAQLTGPQPARKKVRPPSRHVTDLRPGEVLGYRAANGTWALLRVARIDVSRYGDAPVLAGLDFSGDEPPDQAVLDRLADRPGQPPWAVETWRATVHKRVDYGDAGFRRVGHTVERPGDAEVPPCWHAAWSLMAPAMEHRLTAE